MRAIAASCGAGVRLALGGRDGCTTGPLVLGVNAGSTTTKAVLIDPGTRNAVAWHYRRTNGDPLGATRHCLLALVEQVGNRRVCLVGTTGSARELIGVYLDTPHVYNEILAHAAGAARFDPEVNTIFEIGGQDSKYILLRNGVAIDYAMNAACSAAPVRFSENAPHGELGLTVDEIAAEALRAKTPVHFKATCAAFINSDIRTASRRATTAPTSPPAWSTPSSATTWPKSRSIGPSASGCSSRAALP